jgi:nicotinate-nucleotide adenylyltransferase
LKTALYFGSFNPIHIGHLIIAQQVVESSAVDRLWFMVSPQNPLKPSSSLLNEYDRLHLVELAVAGNPKFRASSVEFSLPKPSFTIDTLAYLTEKHPSEEFAVVMGGDSVQNIRKWKNWETLLSRHELIVYNRPGFAVPKDLPGACITVLDAPLLEISATFIRERIKGGGSVRYLLPDAVWKYVEENRYYR